MKQGGMSSPLLCNVYMDNLSLQLHRQSIGCNVGGTVVNDMLYGDDIVLFAASVKAKLSEISSDTHQLHYTPKHHSII